MSRTRNYLLGLSSGYVFTIATVLVGFWLTPFTLRFLDREQFAVFTLAHDVLTWLALLDLGIASALRIQAAQLSGKPDADQLNRLASTAFFAEIGVVIAVVLCGVMLALVFPQFFPIRPDLQRDATRFVLLLLVGTALSLGTQTFSALLVAHQQVHVDNALNLLNLVTRTVLTVVLLKAGWGLYSLAVANLAAKVTTAALAVFRTFRLLPSLRLRWSHVSWSTLKSTSRVGLWLTVNGLAGIVILSLDRVITGKIISVEMVTTLSLTGRLYTLAGSLFDPITNTARPMLAQLIGMGNMEAAVAAYHKLFRLSTGLVVMAAAAIWTGNSLFVTRWVGAQNYGGAWLDFVLALRIVVNALVLPNRAVLGAALVIRPVALTRCAEAMLGLSLAIFLGRYVGLVGVVASIGLAGALTSAWCLPWVTARLFGKQCGRFLWTDASHLLVFSVCLLPWAWLVKSLNPASGFLGAAVASGGTALVGVVFLWFLVFDEVLRQQAIALLCKAKNLCGQHQ